MLTNVFQGSAPHRGKCGMYAHKACGCGQQENQLAESMDTAHGANSRSGICLLFSGGRPQSRPTHVSFKGLDGKEMAPDTHIANVFQAVLRQAGSCYRVAHSQSFSKHSRATSWSWYVGETRNSGTAHPPEPVTSDV